MEILHFMYIFKKRKHGISCDVRNFTFHVQFQAMTHEIPVVSEILCVLHISKIKDMKLLLYISCTYPAASVGSSQLWQHNFEHNRYMKELSIIGEMFKHFS